MTQIPLYQMGASVRHKKRELSEATYQGTTPKGYIKVRHNHIWPYGVEMVVDVFPPHLIEPKGAQV